MKNGSLVKFIDDKQKAIVIAVYKNGNAKVSYEHPFFGERKVIVPISSLEPR